MNDVLKNSELERAALGAVLIDPGALPDVSEILEPTDFYDMRHGAIYRAAQELSIRGITPDPLTISETVKQEIDGVDPAFVVALFNGTPTCVNAREYARDVKRLSNRRKKRAEGLQMANNANNLSLADPDDNTLENSRYIVHNAADALTPRPSVEWIVHGLIYKKSVTVMYGDGGTKKTWSAMFLAACVASGAAWGEFKTNRSRVLFIDEENGEDEIAGRAGNCIRGVQADESADLFYTSLEAFRLDKPTDEEILISVILKQHADLVIMDALADLMVGDENSKQDTQPVFNALRRITEKTGSAIIVIHHANKSGGHRGSSVIKDAPDILLQVTSEIDSNIITFKTEKNRKGKAKRFAMRPIWTDDTFYLTSVELKDQPKVLNKSQEFVIQYLTEHGASPLPEIMASADTCSPEAARKAIYCLASMNMISRTNPGEIGQGVSAIYKLSKEVTE